MYPHRIRLREPWQRDPVVDHLGQARASRRFGYPGRIDEYERVWLTLTGILGPARVSVNGTTVGEADGDREFEVTSLLRPRNELILEAPNVVVFKEVALEVRATAFLRDIRVVLEEGEFIATGTVVGHADRPLDLYLILDRSPAAYSSVTATENGLAFRLTGTNAAEESPAFAKIELVSGAVKWYTVEVDLRQKPIA